MLVYFFKIMEIKSDKWMNEKRLDNVMNTAMT